MSSPRILVTGGGRGIGRAIALRFAREGATVAVTARTRSEIEAVAAQVEELGGRGLSAVMDVADLASVERGLQSILEQTAGALDVVVNNAGVFDVVPFQEMSPSTWYRFVGVNLNGPFHVTLLALGALRRGTRPQVVNICSVAGREAFPGDTAYCATKYGLRGFSDALRLDLEAEGIRVSTVYPGATDTSIFDGVPGDWDRSTMNRPEDVAEVVWAAWQADDAADVSDLEVPPPSG